MASKVIPQELKSFKEALDGKTGSIQSTANDIVSKMSSLADVATSTKSRVESNYKSSTDVNQAASKLSSTSELLKSMGENITSTVSSALGKVTSIISDVTTLENLITDMDTQQGIINSEKGKEKPNYGRLNGAKSQLSDDEKKFDETVSNATSELAALKGMDASINGADSGSSSGTGTDKSAEEVGSNVASELAEYTKYMNQLKYGTLTKKTFTASNGVSLGYFLYVPDYGTGSTPSGLPVLMFMHGGGDSNVGDHVCTDSGLGMMVKNKEVTPSGIIVFPHIVNSCAQYENKSYRDALSELAVSVSKEYNGDPDKISIGGVSYGAVTAYRIVNENPGVYSAVVGVCGTNEITSAFNGVKVWNFNGVASANNHTDKKYCAKQTETVKQVGGEAMPYVTIDGQYSHTNVANIVLTSPQDNGSGEKVWLHEWAFAQTKGKKMTKGTTKKA